jgi:hypothetical protein
MFRLLLKFWFVSLWVLVVKADVITDWNTEALSAIRNESTSPPLAARNLAIMQAAIYDAVNSAAHTHRHYFTNFHTLPETSADAAAAGAAHRVLVNLFQVRARNSSSHSRLHSLRSRTPMRETWVTSSGPMLPTWC